MNFHNPYIFRPQKSKHCMYVYVVSKAATLTPLVVKDTWMVEVKYVTTTGGSFYT
jgi:hypothetical protein